MGQELSSGFQHLTGKELDEIESSMPSDEELYCVADLFKLFADSTRVRILFALSKSEMSVGDLSRLCDMSMSAISHQLRILKQSRLVKCRRQGKTVFYAPADDHVHSMIRQGLEHVNE